MGFGGMDRIGSGVRVKFGFLVANLLHTNFTHLLTKRWSIHIYQSNRIDVCLITSLEKFPQKSEHFRDRQSLFPSQSCESCHTPLFHR